MNLKEGDQLSNLSEIISNYLEENIGRLTLHNQIVQNDQSFQERLKVRHPKLTTKEQGLCALVLTGLSSKEIANRKNSSVSSVEKSRYRLRKKLGISQSDNLLNCLKTI